MWKGFKISNNNPCPLLYCFRVLSYTSFVFILYYLFSFPSTNLNIIIFLLEYFSLKEIDLSFFSFPSSFFIHIGPFCSFVHSTHSQLPYHLVLPFSRFNYKKRYPGVKRGNQGVKEFCNHFLIPNDWLTWLFLNNRRSRRWRKTWPEKGGLIRKERLNVRWPNTPEMNCKQ